MALPTFVAATATPLATQTGGTIDWPTHQADDIGLLLIETGNGDTVTFSVDGGFVAVADAPVASGGSNGTSGETKLWAYWVRCTSGSMTAPVINDPGNHNFGAILVFRGCATSGDPWDVTASSIEGTTATTSVSYPGDTTTVADCLVACILAHGRDTNGAQVSGYTNGDLANIAEVFDDGTVSGHGGGIAVFTGEKATAGAFGAGSATLSAVSFQARLVIAFKPPTVTDSTGSGSPSSTLSSSAAGTASQKFNASGTPTDSLSSSAAGTATRTLNDSSGSGSPTDSLSSSAAGTATQKFNASGTPTDSLSSSATGAATLKFNGSGTPTSTLSSTADGDGTNTTASSPFVVDSFTDTTGTLLDAHVGETGATWTPTADDDAAAAPIIRSDGRLRANGASSYHALQPSGQPVTSDFRMSFDVFNPTGDATPSTNQPSLIARADTGPDDWIDYSYDGLTRDVYLHIGNVLLFRTNTTLTIPIGTSKQLALEVDGDEARLYWGGLKLHTETGITASLDGPALLTWATGSGAPADATALRIDNFYIGDFAMTGSGAPSSTLSSSAAGTASQKFNASGTPSSTLDSDAAGDATNTAGGAFEGAMPSFIAAGTPAADIGPVSPEWPAHQAGDIGLLLIEQSNQGTTTLSDAQGFVAVANSPQGVGAGAGAGGECRLSAYWCRATSSSMAAPTVADVGNHQFAVILTFRSCIETGDPWDVTAGDTVGTATTSVVIPGGTTSGANRLVVAIMAHGRDDAPPLVASFVNADLANFSEVFDSGTQLGHGGGIVVAVGEKADAGTYGATTATLAATSMQGRLSIAFKGATAGATGSGAVSDSLDNSVVAGTATQTFNASGTPSSTLSSSATGDAQNGDVVDSTGSGSPASTLSSSASGNGITEAFVLIATTDNWQTKINNNPNGTLFLIEAGVHRFATAVPKTGQKFVGEGTLEAIMRGCKELTGWTSDGAGHWYVTGQTQQNLNYNPNYSLEPGHPGGYLPEQLWVDGELYEHMLTLADVGPGKWYFDYAADRIYIDHNPTGELVETSVTEQAFNGGGSGVLVQNLVIEKYANAAQVAALECGTSWVVEDCEVRDNHGSGIRMAGSCIVRRNAILRMGQLGYSAGGSNILFEDNEIAYNNTAFFGPGVYGEFGGGKAAFTTNMILRGNWSHHNRGGGMWTDIDNVGALYEDNIIEYNDYRGLFHEISGAAIIRNNIVRYNGLNFYGGTAVNAADRAGILISNSDDTEVYGNTVEYNFRGIMALESERGAEYALTNLYVHDNIIRQTTGRAGGVSDSDSVHNPYSAAANNRWENNTYSIDASVNFRWEQNVDYTRAQWLAAGQDAGSTFTDVLASGTPTDTLSSGASGVASQKFSGSGTPTDTLGSSAAGVVSQAFSGSGAVTSTLTSSATGRAIQADFIGEGALTSTLDSSATGAGGQVGDEFVGAGSATMTLSSAVAAAASQMFSGSGSGTVTLVSTAAGSAEQTAFEGARVIGVTGPLVATGSREMAWPGSTADEEDSLIQEGDLALLFIGTKNEPATLMAGTINADGDASGFTSSDDAVVSSVGTAAASSAVRLDIRWARATSHYMRSVLINDPGAVVVAAMVVLRNAVVSGVPFDVTATSTLSPASTSLTLPGLTTLTENSFIVQAAYHVVDADTSDAVTDIVNASLANLTEVVDRSFTAGPTGSGLLVVTGEKRIVGAVSGTTGTLAESVRAANISLAILPVTPATPSTGTAAITDTLSSTATGEASSTVGAAVGVAVSTLVSTASGVATRALDVTATGAASSTLTSSAEGEADSTTIGQIDAVGAITMSLSSSAYGLCWTRPIVIYPELPPREDTPGGQGRPGRKKPKRILLPEEEPEQPKIRRKRPATMPAPVPEALPLPDTPDVPAFEAITFDPSLWQQLSGPPVRPQTPVVTQQDIAEEEQFLAQLLDLI